jgi:Tfp pilus assembly protein PilX
MNPNSNLPKHTQDSRGVALVTTLLLLSLFTVLTLSMVIATTSDTLIDGYYRNSRGSFYAADSGLNAARQYLITQVKGALPTGYTPSSGSPTLSSNPVTMVSNLTNTSSGFGAYRSMLGSQTSSWPGTFKVDSTGTNTWLIAPNTPSGSQPTCTPTPGCATGGTSSAGVSAYTYTYPYKITVIGQSRTNETNTVEEQGYIILGVNITSNSTTTNSFAGYGMFIDQYPICSGTLVPGTITGPVFTNGAWTFGTSGSYIFTDTVGSHSANLGYQFSGSCYQSPNTQYTSGSQNIIPTFQSGVNLNQPTVALPTNSYNQKRAVLDSQGTISTNPTNLEMNVSLKNVSKTAYPLAGASSGVYLPYTTSAGNVCPCALNGGGIYVEGNATVTITASGASAQVYTIVNGGITTVVTIDTVANTTTVTSGGTTTSITGVPTQEDALGAFQRDATMLYVNGNITALKGGGEGVGSIQDSTAVDVVGSGSVTITGDIRYVHEPVTLTQSGSTPADTLIPANNHGQTLGIFTANGNINLANAQPSRNLQIDASIATISQGGSGGLVNTGSAIGTLTIVGGRIQNTIQNINTTTRNVWFDRRYAVGGFAPPWFPSTVVTTTTTSTSPPPIVNVVRTSWVNTSAQ